MNLSTPLPLFDVAIVGGGISGLTARMQLSSGGLSVLTLEKSRGLGGRASTRRGPDWLADLGAQFFSASDPRWNKILLHYQEHLISCQIDQDSKFPRFIHRYGMSALSRCLKEAAPKAGPIEFSQRVVTIKDKKNDWEIYCESGLKFRAKCLLLAIPFPQAWALVQSSGHPLISKWEKTVSKINYLKCISFGFIRENPLPESIPALFKNPCPSLAGIYDQTRKGLETKRATLVVHTTSEKASEFWDQEDSQVQIKLIQSIRDVLDQKSTALKLEEVIFLHRWRYSEIDPATCSLLGRTNDELDGQFGAPLVLAEDYSSQSSVPRVFQSGLKSAEKLLQYFLGGSLEHQK